LLSIGNYYEVNVLRLTPLVDVVLDTIRVANVQEAAFGPSEQSRVVGDGVAFGGGVDDGEHLLQVIEYELAASQPKGHSTSLWSYPVVENLVLLLQARHESVLGKVVRSRAILGICALDLLVKGLDVCWEQAMELERVALLLGEGRAFVEVRSS
jgi:hypothetical protein